ncbi:MAG: hypothetical protein N4A72_21185 [Bacteroidales bacterium]|nr:hypothetical protein [Bacteroidales bacterium]
MKKTTVLLSVIFILLIRNTDISYGCDQISDILVINSDTLYLDNMMMDYEGFPLETYLNEVGDRTIPGTSGCNYTACYRDYVAFWTIQNDSLFLTDILDCYSYTGLREDTAKADMSTMFGNRYKNGRVFAYWFSNKLYCPFGREFNVYNKEFAYSYKIKKGIVKRFKKHVNYYDTPEGINRFNYHKTRVTLYNKLKESIDWSEINSSCSGNFYIKIGKNGCIKDVVCTDSDCDCKYLDKIITKSLKDIRFDIIKRKGKRITSTYDFMFEFNAESRCLSEIELDLWLKYSKK